MDTFKVALRETLAKNQHLRQPFNLEGLGLELCDSGFPEVILRHIIQTWMFFHNFENDFNYSIILFKNGLTRSRSFHERPHRTDNGKTLRQQSQSRLRLGLYPELPVRFYSL